MIIITLTNDTDNTWNFNTNVLEAYIVYIYFFKFLKLIIPIMSPDIHPHFENLFNDYYSISSFRRFAFNVHTFVYYGNH